ncbi:MAG: phosphoserine phosphatase RsbU/P [Candidatus Hydrogenedentes bacterium]|nr:phosphoserine phosphatase RsbU/P [Candidatus Hydrogenedentota bacterium]
MHHEVKWGVRGRVLVKTVALLLLTSLVTGCPCTYPSAEQTAKVEAALAAFAAEIGIPERDEVRTYGLLIDYLKENPDIYGAAFAFAPLQADGDASKIAPYVCREGDSFICRTLPVSGAMDYAAMEWYTEPAATKQPYWSEPYFDRGGGNIYMVTYSIPVFTEGSSPTLAGVVTSDLPVSDGWR